MSQYPPAFISYSWDNDAHRSWVRRLSDRLRTDGVDTIIDQDVVQLGDELTAFMERISRCDYVLFICTPNYKMKADGRKGGVGYEGAIISAEIFTKGNRRKFIPILASGTWETSTPAWAGSAAGADFSTPAVFEESYGNVLGTITKRTRAAAAPAASEPGVSSPTGRAIKILELIIDEVTEPRADNTPGSSLYVVPFRLSETPTSSWSDLFLNEWKFPRQFTSMHRPGTASVRGNRIVLDGVTMEEIRSFHKATLELCVNEANVKEAEYRRRLAADDAAKKARSDEHRRKVREIGSQIKF